MYYIIIILLAKYNNVYNKFVAFFFNYSLLPISRSKYYTFCRHAFKNQDIESFSFVFSISKVYDSAGIKISNGFFIRTLALGNPVVLLFRTYEYKYNVLQ